MGYDMDTYNFDMAKHLLDAATYTQGKDDSQDCSKGQAVLYLSLLCIEISLKALYEKAGYPVSDLRRLGHDLKRLFRLIHYCRLPDESGRPKKSCGINCVSITFKYPGQDVVASSTIGNLIDRLDEETAEYPNEIRYATALKHYPPEVNLAVATKIHDFCRDQMGVVRLWKPVPEINAKIFEGWSRHRK